MRLVRLGLLGLVMVVSTAQAPTPQEPAYCVNHALDPAMPNTPPHTCACHRPCEGDGPEDRTCASFCRLDHCHCLRECD